MLKNEVPTEVLQVRVIIFTITVNRTRVLIMKESLRKLNRLKVIAINANPCVGKTNCRRRDQEVWSTRPNFDSSRVWMVTRTRWTTKIRCAPNDWARYWFEWNLVQNSLCFTATTTGSISFLFREFEDTTISREN